MQKRDELRSNNKSFTVTVVTLRCGQIACISYGKYLHFSIIRDDIREEKIILTSEHSIIFQRSFFIFAQQ